MLSTCPSRTSRSELATSYKCARPKMETGKDLELLSMYSSVAVKAGTNE